MLKTAADSVHAHACVRTQVHCLTNPSWERYQLVYFVALLLFVVFTLALACAASADNRQLCELEALVAGVLPGYDDGRANQVLQRIARKEEAKKARTKLAARRTISTARKMGSRARIDSLSAREEDLTVRAAKPQASPRASARGEDLSASVAKPPALPRVSSSDAESCGGNDAIAVASAMDEMTRTEVPAPSELHSKPEPAPGPLALNGALSKPLPPIAGGAVSSAEMRTMANRAADAMRFATLNRAWSSNPRLQPLQSTPPSPPPSPPRLDLGTAVTCAARERPLGPGGGHIVHADADESAGHKLTIGAIAACAARERSLRVVGSDSETDEATRPSRLALRLQLAGKRVVSDIRSVNLREAMAQVTGDDPSQVDLNNFVITVVPGATRETHGQEVADISGRGRNASQGRCVQQPCPSQRLLRPW